MSDRFDGLFSDANASGLLTAQFPLSDWKLNSNIYTTGIRSVGLDPFSNKLQVIPSRNIITDNVIIP